MKNTSSNWQDSLNHGLVSRLNRPLRQPGMMKMAMSQRIINRCDSFLNRLPLLSQQIQRWGNNNILSSDAVPIVYAQPVSLTKEPGIESREQNYQPTISNLIQRKLDSSQALPVEADNKTRDFQNSTDLSRDLSSSNISNETTTYLPLKTQINQTSISPSDIPVVSPQTISENLPEGEEMPLQAKFIDSQTASPSTPSQLNLNTPSPSDIDEITTINPTSISPSEIPVVSPQTISENLPESGKMPLQAKFIDSQTASSSTPSQLNLNTPFPSDRDEITTINQTSISPSEIPVISPQTISENLPEGGEMPLQAKFIDSQTASSSTPSQLNLNTPSPSDIDEITTINLTSISPSEILVVSPQTLSGNLPESGEMSLQAKFINSQTASPSTPSQSNLNTLSPSDRDEITTINPTSISPSEIPVVSPQPIFENLPEGGKMLLQAKFIDSQTASPSTPSLTVVNPLNAVFTPKQTQQDNYYSENFSSIEQEESVSHTSQNLPIVIAEPLTSQVNLTEQEISFAINSPNAQNQFFNISNPQINKNNNNQSIDSLPIVSVISSVNSTLKSQSLPLYLARNYQSSNSISQQPNLSNQNSILSNANSSLSPRIFASPSLSTETSVSTMANQANSNVDVDTIANQVERKLMRRLIIESERRGKIR